MKLTTDKNDKNVLSLYVNSSGDIISVNKKTAEPIISFQRTEKITDLLTNKSAVDLSMSKKGLVNIETTVSGYRHGFVLQTDTGFSSKKEVYLFSDQYIRDNFAKNEINAVGDAIANIKNKEISLVSIINSTVESVKTEYPNLKISVSVEDCDDAILVDHTRLKILIMSLFSMAYEVDITDEIRITLRKRNGKHEVILSATAGKSNFLNGIVDFCNAYPFSSTSAILARSLSNEMDITLSIFQEFEYLEMLISFGNDEGLYGVYAGGEADDGMLYRMCMNILFNKKH